MAHNRHDACPDTAAGQLALVLLDEGPANAQIAGVCTSLGWRVWAVEPPVRTTDPIGQITSFLAGPASPDRGVLLGSGEVGLAALAVADEHPERVRGVVVQDAPAPRPDVWEPSCPMLGLPAGDPAVMASAVGTFLTGIAEQAGSGLECPRRIPVLTPDLLNDPDVVGQLRASGPVHQVNVGAVPSWVLTGHEVATATLSDPRLAGEVEMTAGFRRQPAGLAWLHQGEKDLITISSEDHSRLRRLIAQHLTPRAVEALRPRIQAATDEMLDGTSAGEVTDFVASFARPLPVAVLCELFGIPASDRAYFYDWLIVRMVAGPPDVDPDIDDYLSGLIRAKRDRPADDLVSAVLQAGLDQGGEQDLISAIRWVMVGGHRAPATLLSNGLAMLLRQRDQWQRLVANPALAELVVEELLRFVTPFPVGLSRRCAAEITLGNVELPAGSLIGASLVAANRDPARFADPDTFDIDRASNPHLAFGHGHHFCPGAALARAQTQVAFRTLAQRFPHARIASEPDTLDYRVGRVRYLRSMPVVLSPVAGDQGAAA